MVVEEMICKGADIVHQDQVRPMISCLLLYTVLKPYTSKDTDNW